MPSGVIRSLMVLTWLLAAGHGAMGQTNGDRSLVNAHAAADALARQALVLEDPLVILASARTLSRIGVSPEDRSLEFGGPLLIEIAAQLARTDAALAPLVENERGLMFRGSCEGAAKHLIRLRPGEVTSLTYTFSTVEAASIEVRLLTEGGRVEIMVQREDEGGSHPVAVSNMTRVALYAESAILRWEPILNERYVVSIRNPSAKAVAEGRLYAPASDQGDCPRLLSAAD